MTYLPYPPLLITTDRTITVIMVIAISDYKVLTHTTRQWPSILLIGTMTHLWHCSHADVSYFRGASWEGGVASRYSLYRKHPMEWISCRCFWCLFELRISGTQKKKSVQLAVSYNCLSSCSRFDRQFPRVPAQPSGKLSDQCEHYLSLYSSE